VLPKFLRKWRVQSRVPAASEFDARLQEALFANLAGDDATTERALTDAVRIDSDAVNAYLALCRFYRSKGEVGRSIRLHQNLLLRNDLNSEERFSVLFELGKDFQEGGFLRRAVASFEEATAHEPRNALVLRGLVESLSGLGEFRRAAVLERKLAKGEGRGKSGEAALWVKAGELDREQGRVGAARKAVKLALRRDSKCAAAYVLLGEIEVERGRDKAALAAWRKVPSLDRTVAVEVYSRVEAAYAATGKARDYEAFLRALVEADTNDAGATIALARYLTSRGDAALAQNELKRVLDRNPEDVLARTVLGRSLLAQGREDDIVSEYTSLLALLEKNGNAAAGENGE
jgi:lipopolysaccharide biosynthesis regulator YciM